MSKMSKLWLSIILSIMTIVLVILGVALSGMLPEVIQQGTKDCLILFGAIMCFLLATCSCISGVVFLILSFKGE